MTHHTLITHNIQSSSVISSNIILSLVMDFSGNALHSPHPTISLTSSRVIVATRCRIHA
ncbi:hypothetical protein HanRHA438_Chr15g0694591 [Helianthus annuus]|nr:hypothetical protein HanRHA438_Chr15g0694591 [Helianthus annuus]